MIVTTTVHPDRETWLAARRGRITGTTAAAILGVSPWASPWDVYAREVLGEPVSAGPSEEIAQRGLELEPVALARWRRADRRGEGWLADPAGGIVTAERSDRPLWLASPDALVCVGPDDLIVGGVEIKTVSRSDLGRFWDDDQPEPSWVRHLDDQDVEPGDDGGHVPPGWLVQILTYMEVTRAEWWDLVIMGPHIDHTHILRVYRDDEAQARIVRSCEAWWQRHIIEREPPAVDDSDACYRALRAMWPPSTRVDVVELGDEAEALAESYRIGMETRKEGEATRKAARNHLMRLMEGAAVATTAHHTIKIDARGAIRVTARR